MPAVPAVPDLEDDLRLALRLADRADELTTAAFRRRDLIVETKPDLTPVTEVDRAVERALRDELAASRPGDVVVGEEYGSSGAGDSARRRWIIDPVDGTKNFVRRIPVWASLIALESGGVLAVGVVSAPALGRRWYAAKGLGAFAGPPAGPAEPIGVSAVSRLDDAQLSYSSLNLWGDARPNLVALAERCWRSRAFGDFWSHVLVAEGACDIGLDPVASLWDLAALQVIVEEAGGRFTDFSGVARPDGGSAISSNGLLHEQARSILTRGAP